MKNEINRDLVVKKTKNVFITTMVLFAISMITSCENDTNGPNHPKQNPNAVAVDLGLSVKWANCNVGATKPEEYGDYFAWGETTPKEEYEWSTYFDTKNEGLTFIKYKAKGGHTLELEDDVAHVNWGGAWRMPTETEQDELRNKCTWTWTTQNGVNGYLVKSKKNSNSIFLPAAGIRMGTLLSNDGLDGRYWSSSLNMEDRSNSAYCIYFNVNYVMYGGLSRYYGRSVRPVCK